MTQVVNCLKEEYDVYVGRPSKWGNPFSHLKESQGKFKVSSRKEAVESFKNWILYGDGKYLLNDIHELKDKKLGCFCFPKLCHGDILSQICNGKIQPQRSIF